MVIFVFEMPSQTNEYLEANDLNGSGGTENIGSVTWAGFRNPQFEYPQEKLKDKVIQIKDEQKI